ncbi:MAG: fasciclin [Flavobacteriales bacterium]|nr:fasciclin [Flavobacteriales bacterium]
MKKVFYFFGLTALLFGNQSVAQDNPCGVEGIVVEASSYQYAPAALEIEAGQTVVWVNMGGFHDVNGVESSIGENWNNPETFSTGAVSGNMDGVCIGSHTFTVEGTYDYDCSIGNHAAEGMVATITVNPAQVNNSVVDIIVNSEVHTLLEAAVGAAGLVDALSGDGPFTVFAPTDDAIVALTETLEITADELLALDNLGDILQYHVVGASAYAADLSDGQTIETLLGENITVSITADGVFINNAQVTLADIAADNGVVHVIDAVLLPPAPPTNTVVDVIVNSEDHTLLEAALGAAGLVDALNGDGPFTVFAPTDDAFTALTEVLEVTVDELLAYPLLPAVLQYHVVAAEAYAADLSNGQEIETLLGEDIIVSITADGVFINNAQVIVADIAADNGVVHVIDAVLLPELEEETTVVDIIVDSEDHTLLEAAVGAAGLVEALSGEGPFTVFAPTDAAIVALTEALDITADELLALPNLADILKYHVVSAEAYAADLTDGQVITTLEGSSVTVSITADGVFINDAQVTVADLEADNGVVHVINAVLLPPTTSVAELASFELNIYPNPVHDGTFNVSGAWEAGANIEVFELTGRKVFETTSTQTTVTVSIDGWEAGTYAVRITDDVRTATQLFLID